MTRDTAMDAMRDGAAMVRACHERDHEARETILRHGDHEAIASALASMLAAVLRAPLGGCRHCVGEFIDDWQADLRDATREAQ